MVLERALILRMEGLLNPRGRLHLNLYWHPETQLDTDLYSAAILRWEVEKAKNWSERETNVFHPRKYRGRASKVVGDEAS